MLTGGTAMAHGEDPGAPVARLAAELLGVDREAAFRESLSTLFRRLRDDDFIPDPSLHEAMLILSGRPVGARSRLSEDAVRARGEAP